MDKSEFHAYLRNAFQRYNQIPTINRDEKREMKQYINGLMTTSRFFGVSYEDLKDIVDSEANYDIPTFVRQHVSIDF